MNSLLALGFVVLGIALTLGVILRLARGAARLIDMSDAYREVALERGLSVDTRGVSIRGHLGDRRLWLGEVLEGFGVERRTEVRGILAFARPLGVGLELRSRTRWERWFARHGVAMALEDAALDKRLAVRCDDPATLRALCTPDTLAALGVLADRATHLAVSDDEIHVRLPEAPDSAGEARAWLDALLKLAEALEGARASIPAPHALDGLDARWAPLAEELGLVVEPAWPALVGLADGRRLEILARREHSGYAALLVLHFRPHPELGLLLQPQRDPDGYWNVGQDIQLGDAAFDPVFVVKGWDPPSVRNRLGAEARAALLRLAARGALVVDDRAIALRGLPFDVPALRDAVGEATLAARAMGW